MNERSTKRAPAVAASRNAFASGFRRPPDHVDTLSGQRRRAPLVHDPDEPKVSVRVMRGTIHVPDPAAPKIPVGFDTMANRMVEAAACTVHYPGELIELSASDAARLTALGIADLPEAEPLPLPTAD